MKKSIFKFIQAAAFIGLGIFFIVFFWNKLTPDQQEKIVDNFLKADYFWIILALMAGVMSHIFRAARWNLLIETFSPAPSTAKTFWAVMAGYLANLAVPRLGEFTRCAMLSKQTRVPFDKLLGSVLAERAFDFIFFLLLLFSTLILFYDKIITYVETRLLKGFFEKTDALSHWKLWIILGVILLLFAATLYCLRKFRNTPFVQKVRNVLRNLIHGLLSIIKLKRVGLFMLYTLLIWVMYWLIVYLMYFSLSSTTGLSPESAFMVLVYGTIGIIIIQGGIGIYPVIVSEILLIYHTDIADGFSIGWLSWGVQTIMILVLGMISFILVNFQAKNKDGLQNSDKQQNS